MTAPSPAVERSRGPDALLLVDDEEALVELLGLGLGRLGWRVFGFVEPGEALAAFRAAPAEFGAAVCDLSMPGMSGGALAREILRARPGIPVVLTSGWVRAEDEAAGRALGILGFAAKGSSVEEIVRAIDLLLRGGAGPGEPPDSEAA